jgi:tetratricopeptide (TPR) repeat protein
MDTDKRKLANLGIMLGLSMFLFLIFLWVQASSLAIISQNSPRNIDEVLEQVMNYEAVYLRFVITILFLLVFCAIFLVDKWPEVSFTKVGILAGIPLVIVALGLGFYTNQRIIQADIAFKAADSFTTPGYWPAAITIYHRALELSPKEDYYYLFLARAYLEYAKTMENNAQRLQLIQQAERDMLNAQRINPLNTDHTANLARIHSTWAEYAEDQDDKAYHTARASEYYDAATRLSPFNARLWGEWALLLFSQMADFNQAKTRLDKALEIDPTYEWLYSLQGEFYFRQAERLSDQEHEKNNLYQRALEAYQKGLDLIPENDTASRFRNALSIARTYSRLRQYEESIQTYLSALVIFPETPDKWRIHEVVARLFLEIGDRDQALSFAQSSKDLAPEGQDSRLDELIELIKETP